MTGGAEYRVAGHHEAAIFRAVGELQAPEIFFLLPEMPGANDAQSIRRVPTRCSPGRSDASEETGQEQVPRSRVRVPRGAGRTTCGSSPRGSPVGSPSSSKCGSKTGRQGRPGTVQSPAALARERLRPNRQRYLGPGSAVSAAGWLRPESPIAQQAVVRARRSKTASGSSETQTASQASGRCWSAAIGWMWPRRRTVVPSMADRPVSPAAAWG